MPAHLCGSKSLITFYQLLTKPDFPSLLEETAKPRPEMNN